jgi:hypothetical protein
MKIHWIKPQPLIILKEQIMLRYESRHEGDMDQVKQISTRPDVGDIVIYFKDNTYTHANPEALTFQ